MGYNGSNRKGYDVRYRGFPKSSMRSVDSMFFGRHGLVTGAAKLVSAGLKDLTATPSYSRSRSSGTYYVFRTSSGKDQKSLLDIDFKKLSNESYADAITDFFERRKQFEILREKENRLLEELGGKKRSLKILSFFKFLFKRKISTITSEIETLNNRLEEINEQPIDISFRLENVAETLDQRFIDSFMRLFRDTKMSVVTSSENTYSPNEIPSYCHFYEIGRERISINTESGPLTNVKCCSIVFGNLALYFYSDVLIITNSSKEMAIINYDDITLSSRNVSIVEDQSFSTSGYNVGGKEYLHERKSGGPDLRYSYNPSRPMICYYNLVLKHNKNILFNFISNAEEPVKEFVYSFNLAKGGWYIMNPEHLSKDVFDIISSCADSLYDVKRTCYRILDQTNYKYEPYVRMDATMMNNHVCHFILSDIHAILVDGVKEESIEQGMWALLYVASKVLNYYSMYNSYDHLAGLLNHAPQLYSAIQNKIESEIALGREKVDIDFLLNQLSNDDVERYHSSLNTLRKLVSSSKEINNCFITLRSISIDAKFSCPIDCQYYKHNNCYWAQNTHIQVHEHKLEGIIVFFNLSYKKQDSSFFFYPGSVILKDSNSVEYMGVSLCDSISKLGSWGRHSLVNTQENLYVFFPKLEEGATIDAIRFYSLGKQKDFVEFSSSDVEKLYLPFSDFITTDIMALRLGPLYSLLKKLSQSANTIVREDLALLKELYEKHLLSGNEINKVLKGFSIE